MEKINLLSLYENSISRNEQKNIKGSLDPEGKACSSACKPNRGEDWVTLSVNNTMNVMRDLNTPQRPPAKWID